MHYASNAGDQLLVADLLKRGADIHAKHILGYTALHIASRQGHQPVVAELLNNGADINSKSPKGLTSLHLASEQGHQDVVIELLKNNADINVKTNSGFTALHFASQNGHHAVADELLKNKADISIKDNAGNTALHIASYKEDKYLVVKLLKSGVNLEFNTEIKLLKNEIKNLFGKKSSVYKEINLYSSSPVEYVLTHNDKAKAAISAIKNIENNLDFADYKKLQNCLEAQSVDVSLDLNDLCGKNGSYYLLYSEL